MAKIRKSVANREKSYGNETSFESKVRLQEVFTSMIRTVTNVNETGNLTLERIKTALTGRCENNSFISVWEGIINIKRQDDKAGTAEVYETALKNFKEITKVSYSDGSSIDAAVIQKWVEGMNDRGFASATQGIYLRTCRMVINRCIGDGYMMPKAYMFGKSSNKIKIPVGASRKGWYLNVSQMMELYNHLPLTSMPPRYRWNTFQMQWVIALATGDKSQCAIFRPIPLRSESSLITSCLVLKTKVSHPMSFLQTKSSKTSLERWRNILRRT